MGAPLCTHIKVDGQRCGSPALKGTELCFHHSAVKTALGKVTPLDKVPYGGFTPIPFVFPEDRAAMQINYFLLLQAINEGRIEKRVADLMLRMLKSMDKNLGKKGSLVEDCASSDTRSAQESAPAPAPMNAETAAASAVIDEVNASVPLGYADLLGRGGPGNPLYPEGQRVINLYCQKPMDR